MSALADRSYTTRYALKRARIQAQAFNAARAQNQASGAIILPQVGVRGIVGDSDRLSRRLGQIRIYREQNPAPCTGTIVGGLVVAEPFPNADGTGCCDPDSNNLIVVG
jgi:hypothetical protein